VVIVLAAGLKARVFKPGRERRIHKGDKNRSTTSFGGNVKPAVPRRKTSRLVKNPYSMKEILVGKIDGHFSPSVSYFATRCLLVTAREPGE
jgi:hypothetical protein